MKKKKIDHSKGGNATLEKYGNIHFSKIGINRWKKYWIELKAVDPEKYKKNRARALKKRLKE